jgi:hypothetical protein
MNSNDTSADMTAILARVGDKRDFIGSLFGGWRAAFRSEVTEALGISPEFATALGLCLRPRPDEWERDVAEIAGACGCDSAKLANFLRQALAVERLAEAPQVGDVVDGRLLAARDRGNEDDE